MHAIVLLLSVALCAAACTGQAAGAPQAGSASGAPTYAPAVAVASSAATAAPSLVAATPGPRPSGPVPQPFGLAANGLVLYGTTTGDIRSLNLANGATATILGGTDGVAVVSPDGTRMLFERTAAGATTGWVADVDGTDAREIPPSEAKIGWTEWAPDSRRILTVPEAGGDVTIRDVDSGATSSVHAPIPIRVASWLADGRLLVASASGPGVPSVFATIAEDGTGYAVVPTTDATEAYSVSGDGGRFTYMSSGTEPGTESLIHVVDLGAGSDTLLTKPDVRFAYQEPVFSPDGRWVKTDRHDAVGYKVVLLPANGKGKPVALGPQQQGDEGEAVTTWAPDARALIVTYSKTGETWMFDVASGSGKQVDWPDLGGAVSWQRVTP